jgi:hypothetical protein
MSVEIIGRKEERDSNRVYIKKPDGTYSFSKKIGVLRTTTPIDQASYALVQEGNQVNRAISMKQGYNGQNQSNTIISVLNDGLIVPTARIFMSHYKNANDAKKGRSVLYDASGNIIEGERLRSYVKMLNSDCWVWLNGGFVKGSGFKDLDLEIVTGLDNENPQFNISPLEEC